MTATTRTVSFILEPFEPTPAHYEAIVRIHNAVWPEYHDTVADWQRWDRLREPQYFFRRWLVRWAETGEYVAYANVMHTYWAHTPQRFAIDLDVLPAFQRRGIGSALYREARAAIASFDPLSLELATRADRTHALRFIEKLGGCELKTTLNISRLELATFDSADYAAVVARVQASGLTVRSLAELKQSDPDHKRKIYDLVSEVQNDIPWHDTLSMEPFDTWVKWFDESARRIEEAYLLAVDGDQRYVGVTMLFRAEGTDEKVYTGLTGVRRAYRRQGVALALKALSLGWVKENRPNPASPPPAVITDNEENNPMYQINLCLGFRPEPPRLVFLQTLRPAANGQQPE